MEPVWYPVRNNLKNHFINKLVLNLVSPAFWSGSADLSGPAICDSQDVHCLF